MAEFLLILAAIPIALAIGAALMAAAQRGKEPDHG